MPFRNIQFAIILSAVLMVIIVGCGGNSDPEATAGLNPTSTPRPTATSGPEPTATPIPTATPSPTPAPTATPTATPTPVEPDVAFQALFNLADSLEVPPNTISITSYSQSSWPTSALDCPGFGVTYSDGTISGWIVNLEVDGSPYEYHVSESGDTLVNCTENRALMASAVNIVELAGLRTATKIEMSRLTATGEYDLKATITVASEITSIVDTIDLLMLPGPAEDCQPSFQLVFFTPSGDQTIQTICRGNVQLIRGDQAFWAGQDALAPTEFGSVIGPYFSGDQIPELPE